MINNPPNKDEDRDPNVKARNLNPKPTIIGILNSGPYKKGVYESGVYTGV